MPDPPAPCLIPNPCLNPSTCLTSQPPSHTDQNPFPGGGATAASAPQEAPQTVILRGGCQFAGSHMSETAASLSHDCPLQGASHGALLSPKPLESLPLPPATCPHILSSPSGADQPVLQSPRQLDTIRPALRGKSAPTPCRWSLKNRTDFHWTSSANAVTKRSPQRCPASSDHRRCSEHL